MEKKKCTPGKGGSKQTQEQIPVVPVSERDYFGTVNIPGSQKGSHWRVWARVAMWID